MTIVLCRKIFLALIPFLIWFCFVLPASTASAQGFASTDDLQGNAREAVRLLDAIAAEFQRVSCSVEDEFCWWFQFHRNIGESGPQPMSRFAQEVPFRYDQNLGYGYFQGEAHIFQYPGYWLLKGVPLSTPLRSGGSLGEYIEGTPWAAVYQHTALKVHPTFINEELSWYWLGQAFLPNSLEDLPEPRLPSDQRACSASHYLTGLYLHNPLAFSRQLSYHDASVRQLMQQVPQAAFLNYSQFYLITHVAEAYSLSGRQDLLDVYLLDYLIRYVWHFRRRYEAAVYQGQGPTALIRERSELAYMAADMLGHLRYGLKLYLQLEANPLVDNR